MYRYYENIRTSSNQGPQGKHHKGAHVYLNQNTSGTMTTAYGEEWSTLPGNMRWHSTNNDLNVEERKEYRMTQGFLLQNTSGGGLFTVLGY